MYMLASMRKLSVVFLSLFLTYAGVAWALEACLRHDGHSDHSTFENHSDSHSSVGHDHSLDIKVSRLTWFFFPTPSPPRLETIFGWKRCLKELSRFPPQSILLAICFFLFSKSNRAA